MCDQPSAESIIITVSPFETLPTSLLSESGRLRTMMRVFAETVAIHASSSDISIE